MKFAIVARKVKGAVVTDVVRVADKVVVATASFSKAIALRNALNAGGAA